MTIFKIFTRAYWQGTSTTTPPEVKPEERSRSDSTSSVPKDFLTTEERGQLRACSQIHQARAIVDLKEAREAIAEDLVGMQEIDKVTLLEVRSELLDHPGQRVSCEEGDLLIDGLLSPDSLEAAVDRVLSGSADSTSGASLVDSLFLTKNPEDVTKLQMASVRAAIRKYTTIESGSYYYMTDGARQYNLYTNSYDELRGNLVSLREELKRVKERIPDS